MRKRRVFVARTPLGHRVVLTRDRWREIIRFKHPALAGREAEVQACVAEPDHVRASAKDANVHLYYRKAAKVWLCTVVAGDNLQARFVVTAYLTKTIKEGPDVWTK